MGRPVRIRFGCCQLGYIATGGVAHGEPGPGMSDMANRLILAYMNANFQWAVSERRFSFLPETSDSGTGRFAHCLAQAISFAGRIMTACGTTIVSAFQPRLFSLA